MNIRSYRRGSGYGHIDLRKNRKRKAAAAAVWNITVGSLATYGYLELIAQLHGW